MLCYCSYASVSTGLSNPDDVTAFTRENLNLAHIFDDAKWESKRNEIKNLFLAHVLSASYLRQSAPKPPTSTPTTACTPSSTSPWRMGAASSSASAPPGRGGSRPPRPWKNSTDPVLRYYAEFGAVFCAIRQRGGAKAIDTRAD